MVTISSSGAIFARPVGPPIMPNVQDVMVEELQHASPEINNAFRLRALQWEND